MSYDLQVEVFDEITDSYKEFNIMIDSYDEGQEAVICRAPEDCEEAIPAEVEFTAYVNGDIVKVAEHLFSEVESQVLNHLEK